MPRSGRRGESARVAGTLGPGRGGAHGGNPGPMPRRDRWAGGLRVHPVEPPVPLAKVEDPHHIECPCPGASRPASPRREGGTRAGRPGSGGASHPSRWTCRKGRRAASAAPRASGRASPAARSAAPGPRGPGPAGRASGVVQVDPCAPGVELLGAAPHRHHGPGRPVPRGRCAPWRHPGQLRRATTRGWRRSQRGNPVPRSLSLSAVLTVGQGFPPGTPGGGGGPKA